MRIASLGVIWLAWCVPAFAGSPPEWMLELTVRGQEIEGMPLAWNRQAVHLLARDGRLWEFDPRQAADYHKTANRFRGYSPSELRAVLLRELGQDYEVSGTSHYLVAHPRGERERWAGRFEDLYRSFVHYFSVRGFEVLQPRFPLLGVVCRNREEFLRYSASQDSPVSSGVQGFYSLKSNRILLYDLGEEADSTSWEQNASILIHEATHQTAFNTGIHSRWTPPPDWVAEGLATLFEAPGVYNSRDHTRAADRINRGRLREFRERVFPEHRPELLADLIASDRLFRLDPSAAYAEAWALTFYLVETQPRRYTEYLARTANRPPFESYTPQERTADFRAVFGDDWRMLEARFLRFIEQLK